MDSAAAAVAAVEVAAVEVDVETEDKMTMRSGLVALAIVLAAAAKSETQRSFATPESAMSALVDALKKNDAPALLEILGSAAKPLLDSGDPVADAGARRKFLDAHAEGYTSEAVDQTRVVFEVGRDKWPFPIPLERRDLRWYFDAESGVDEMVSRRIGQNELDAIQVAAAYVDAQRDYGMLSLEDNPIPHYAQKFFSSPGKRDGLYWESAPGEDPSPLGPLIAEAQAEGYRRDPRGRPRPYHGYYYRILTKQGLNAEDGAYNYIVGGKMIGGFALIATPAEYGSSGIMTFIVNHDGVIYQRDFGPRTAKRAKAITAFDPDPGWTMVDKEDLTPRDQTEEPIATRDQSR